MHRRSSSLEVVAGLVEEHVPIYKSGQWDPVVAAETGYGSCFAKNVIGAVALSHISSMVVTGIQWGKKQHPRLSGGFMLSDSQPRPGHSSLLVAREALPRNIQMISFNDKMRKNDDWVIADFNPQDEEPYAIVTNDAIVPTEHGVASGVHIYPWYEAGQKYTEALGISDSVFHVITEQEISEIVLASLREQANPREIPR